MEIYRLGWRVKGHVGCSSSTPMSPLIRWKIIKLYIYKMGNKQRSIYWNPIKLGGNKMNKRRERKREIPSISKPFLPFCTCPTSRWVCSSPTSVSYHFPLLFFFSLSFSRSITSAFFLLLLLHCILPGNVYQLESNFPPIRTDLH